MLAHNLSCIKNPDLKPFQILFIRYSAASKPLKSYEYRKIYFHWPKNIGGDAFQHENKSLLFPFL